MICDIWSSLQVLAQTFLSTMLTGYMALSCIPSLLLTGTLCFLVKVRNIFFYSTTGIQRWARLWSRDWDWDQGGLKAGLKLWDHLPKVSVSVSKFETDFKSISISLKFWDLNAKGSVSVSKCNRWSHSSQILEPSKKVIFVSTFHGFIC